MDLIQLKIPPEKLAKMANAIETHIISGDAQEDAQDLQKILTWLRYRHSKWTAAHPDEPAA